MAKKNKGWIKVYRDITENEIWASGAPFDRRSAWIDLLLMVNHEERTIILRNGSRVVLQPGQCFTSTIHLAERWRWSRNRVDRFLKLLTEQGMCMVNGATRGTTITIVNWDFFQGGRATNGATDGATKRATDGATDGARTRMNYQECIKNVNNKKEPSPVPVSFGGREYE